YGQLFPRGEAGLAELESQILSVKGHLQYRFAAWTHQPDNKYRDECDAAKKILEKADAIRPNSYMILQLLGNILVDPIFDPDGHELLKAKKCFDQSIKLKETDFYGYQQLARVQERELELFGPPK